MSSVLSAVALACSASKAAAFSMSRTAVNVGSRRSSPGVSRLVRLASSASTTPPPTTDDETMDEGDSSIYATQTEALTKLDSDFLKTMRDRGFLHQCS
jgi:hypothetical protein